MIIHEMARKIVADRMTGFRLVPQKRHGDVWRLCHRASHRSESVGFGFYVSNFGSSRPTARWPGSSCSCCGVAHQPCPAVGAELDAELERGRPLQAGMHAEHELQLPPKAPASWKRTKPPRTRTSNSDADYAALETPRVKPTLRVSPGARVQSKSMITNHYRRNRAWGRYRCSPASVPRCWSATWRLSWSNDANPAAVHNSAAIPAVVPTCAAPSA
jgi:hypothetical protein